MNKKTPFSTSLLICLLYLCFISLGSNFSSIDGAKVRFAVRILFFLFLVIFGYNKKEEVGRASLLYLPFFLLFPFSNYVSLFIRGSFSFYYSNELIFLLFDCLLTAFVEEKLFRSLFIYNDSKDKWKSILLSSLVFALSHIFNGFSIQTLMQVVYTFGLGVILGSIYAYGGGFIYSFILHFMFNFFNGALYNYFKPTKIDTLYIVSNVIIGVIIVVYYLLIVFIKTRKKE